LLKKRKLFELRGVEIVTRLGRSDAPSEDDNLLMKNYPRRKEALQVLENKLAGVWVQG
jgi:hypothetical protein